jgi:Trehalose utilisation
VPRVPPALSVLFLGDKGLHHPADRYAQIAPVLAGRGIEVEYTENVTDLNPTKLSRYDALLIYANTTRITQDQEKALLDYVAAGGGFVPLHCASFCFALPAGLKAKLFVAEPQVFKPITMTWDHLGRLFVAETLDYPNELQPKGKGRDRISIVEDTDGDGKADKVSLFADNLSIPTSLCYANGGLIVAQSPDMLFLKDTDGDGRADERKVLFTGFRTNDTHAGPSNLRYGLDNWIYAIIGYAGFSGKVGAERHTFRQGFFRFKSDGSELEFLRSTNDNSWGVGISEEGLLFGSTANGCPSVYMPIANRYDESVRGMAPSVLQNMADSTVSRTSRARSRRSSLPASRSATWP